MDGVGGCALIGVVIGVEVVNDCGRDFVLGVIAIGVFVDFDFAAALANLYWL